jgi:hypothetical protein
MRGPLRGPHRRQAGGDHDCQQDADDEQDHEQFNQREPCLSILLEAEASHAEPLARL